MKTLSPRTLRLNFTKKRKVVGKLCLVLLDTVLTAGGLAHILIKSYFHFGKPKRMPKNYFN